MNTFNKLLELVPRLRKLSTESQIVLEAKLKWLQRSLVAEQVWGDCVAFKIYKDADDKLFVYHDQYNIMAEVRVYLKQPNRDRDILVCHLEKWNDRPQINIHCLREGLWIDYLHEAAAESVIKVEIEKQRIKDEKEQRFSPIDDRSTFQGDQEP
jgi:hypothetical protein